MLFSVDRHEWHLAVADGSDTHGKSNKIIVHKCENTVSIEFNY